MGLFSRKVSCLGLDIGEHSMKMLEIRKTGGSYEIVNFGIMPTPQGYMEGSSIINEQGVIMTLQKLREKMKVEQPKVAVAVSGDNVIVRSLTVPVMSDRELADAVRFEAEAQLPIPAKDVTIDFVKHDIVMDGSVKKQEVLAVAVRNDIINKMVRVLEGAGMQPLVMDVEPLALLRAIKRLNPTMIPRDNSYAIVNIGSWSTNISVFEKGRLSFTRTLGFGGYRLSMSLVEHYSMTFEDAESTKKMIDLSGESDQHGLSVLLYQKQEILTPLIDDLSAEIGRSLEYYQAQHRGQQIMKVFITGGGAQLKGLASYIGDELDLPVAVFDPVKHLKLSDKVKVIEREIQEAGASLTQAAGLALSEVE